MNRGFRPVTGLTSGVEGRLNIKELISRTRCRLCREKGQWARECQNRENKSPEMVKKRRHHSLSTSEETTVRQVTLARGDRHKMPSSLDWTRYS